VISALTKFPFYMRSIKSTANFSGTPASKWLKRTS
jgi:hypothetical protein